MHDHLITAVVIDSLIHRAVKLDFAPTPNDILKALEEREDANDLGWVKQTLRFIANENQYDTPLCILLKKCDTVELRKQDFMVQFEPLFKEFNEQDESQDTKSWKYIVFSFKLNMKGAKKALPNFLLQFRNSPSFSSLTSFIYQYGLHYDENRLPNGVKTNLGLNRSKYDILNDLCKFLDFDYSSYDNDKIIHQPNTA